MISSAHCQTMGTLYTICSLIYSKYIASSCQCIRLYSLHFFFINVSLRRDYASKIHHLCVDKCIQCSMPFDISSFQTSATLNKWRKSQMHYNMVSISILLCVPFLLQKNSMWTKKKNVKICLKILFGISYIFCYAMKLKADIIESTVSEPVTDFKVYCGVKIAYANKNWVQKKLPSMPHIHQFSSNNVTGNCFIFFHFPILLFVRFLFIIIIMDVGRA